MARVNIDILGISKLKWTGKSEFGSYDHYIYYRGQESYRGNRVALIVNKKVQSAILGCDLKNDRMILVHYQGMSFNITVIQVNASSTSAEEAEVDHFCEDLVEKAMATHSSVLAWRIPGTGEPRELPSVGSHRVGHD